MGVFCGFEELSNLEEMRRARGVLRSNTVDCLMAQLQMFAYGVLSVHVTLMGRYMHDLETSAGGTRIANTVYTTQPVSHTRQYRVHP
jgi:hypothetical protein